MCVTVFYLYFDLHITQREDTGGHDHLSHEGRIFLKKNDTFYVSEFILIYKKWFIKRCDIHSPSL